MMGSTGSDVSDLQARLMEMGYYTGAIFEITMDGYNFSIAGGGRYDKMIGKFSGQDVAASGFSIGFERIVTILKDHMESGYKLELSQKVRALREGQQRKNQERVAEFLANNSEYARILMEKARENSTR